MLTNDDHRPIHLPRGVKPNTLAGIRAILHRALNKWCENPATRTQPFQIKTFLGKTTYPHGWTRPPLSLLIAHYRTQNPETAEAQAAKCTGNLLKQVVRDHPHPFKKTKHKKALQYRLLE